MQKPVLVRRLLSLPRGTTGSSSGKGAADNPQLRESKWLVVRDQTDGDAKDTSQEPVHQGKCLRLPVSSGSFPKEPSLGPKHGQSQTLAPTVCVVSVMGLSGAGGAPRGPSLPHQQTLLPCACGDYRNRMFQERETVVTAQVQNSSIPIRNRDWFPVPGFHMVQEERGNSKACVMVPAALPCLLLLARR